MLDAFERFLDTPALVIKLGEYRRRIVLGVAQGDHEHAHLAGEQKSDQRLKGQIALASEIPGITPGGVEKGRALNVVGEIA